MVATSLGLGHVLAADPVALVRGRRGTIVAHGWEALEIGQGTVLLLGLDLPQDSLQLGVKHVTQTE